MTATIDCGEGWTWNTYSDYAHGPNGEKIPMGIEGARQDAPKCVQRTRLVYEIGVAQRKLARLAGELEALDEQPGLQRGP